jgi:hypothetical protein
MIEPGRDNFGSVEATRAALAGISVRIEAEEDLSVRPCQPPQPDTGSPSNGAGPPSTEQLAGIYVLVQAPEDLTVRPFTPKAG